MYQHYSTSDLQLASALIAGGFEITSFIKEGRKLMFYFPSSHDIAVFVENYFLGKTKVDPLAYSIAQKNLKNYLFNTKQ